MLDTLNPRRGRILKHVIEEYVVTAQPVSSDTVVRKYLPSVSSATVRNELAALEDFGYLYHPHTSAGRVPSDLGYRYYVEELMGGARLSEMEQRTISHQFHQVELDVSEWMRLAASVLTVEVRNPVLVAPPVAPVRRLRRLDLVPISASAVLLVLILQSGAVRQQVVRVGEDLAPEDLARLAHTWNQRLVGRSAREVRQAGIDEAQPIIEAVVEILEDGDRQAAGRGDILIEGLSYIAAQPEFGTSERLLPIVEALERESVLGSLMEPLLRSEGVYVAIGSEQPLQGLQECSVVLATYGRPDEVFGVVGVIGPTRLPYWRAVPMVDYIAGMLDRLLEETFLS